MTTTNIAALPDDLAERLLAELAPVEPPRRLALRERLLARVRDSEPPTLTVAHDEGRWRKIGPGVEMKVLRRDDDSESILVRLEPGAELPRHGHTSDEECLVLEGEITLAGRLHRAGDYHLARRGSVHETAHSPSGVLMLVRGANSATHTVDLR